jgi:hypothetical protein
MKLKAQSLLLAVLLGFIYVADAQNTWIPSSSQSLSWETVAASADGTRMLAAVYGQELYLSTNAGSSWVATSTGAPNGYGWYATASSADGTNLMAAGLFIEGIYISTNGGASWYPSGATNGNWISLYSSANGRLMVGSTAASNGQIYYSTNFGLTWTNASAPGTYWRGMAGTPDGTTLFSSDNSYNGRIYKSTNFGASWAPLSGSPNVGYWDKLACSTNGNFVIAASDGGGNPAHIYISTNSGTNWSVPPGSPMGIWKGLICSSDGTKIVALAQDAGIFSSSDSGVTWMADNAPNTLLWVGLAGSADCTKLAATANDAPIYINVIIPVLTITPAGTNVLLSWPTNAPGFRLTENADLTTTNWLTVTNPIDLVGTQNQVAVPDGGSSAFFQLQNP